MNLRRSDLWITGGALLLLLLWDASGLDMVLERSWGTHAGFVWRDHWFTSRVLHDGGRWLGFAALGLLALNVVWPSFKGLDRQASLRWLLATLAILLLVPLLKKTSQTSCPWELAEFGGIAQYVSHWRFGFGDGGPGHCFPSGHATSAVAFFTGWFALRDGHPRAARWWLLVVCALALLFGWAQMARGAHFASHTMWSAWLCWTLALLALAPRRRAALQPALP